MVKEETRSRRLGKVAAGNGDTEPQTLQEYFGDVPRRELDDETRERLRESIEQKLETDSKHAEESHNMSMKERRASLIATRVATASLGVWAVIGVSMLAKSCINFDKSPKFKV